MVAVTRHSSSTPPVATFGLTLSGCLALVVAMGIGRFAYTPLLPLMIEEGRLTMAGGGIIASIHFFGYWTGALAAVRLRRLSVSTLLAALAGVGIVSIGMALMSSYAAWLVLRFLAGALSAVVLVFVGSTIVRQLNLAGQSELQGWVFSGVGIGIMLVGLLTLGMMHAGYSSTIGWAVFGAIALVATMAVAVLLDRRRELSPVVAATNLGATTRLPAGVVIAYGMAGFGYVIPATYLPVMAREFVADPLAFGWGWPMFGVAALLSTLAAAKLHARFSSRTIWFAGQLVLALGLLLPVAVPGLFPILLSAVAVGGTFMVITMAGLKEAHRLTLGHDVQRAVAVLTTAFAGGQTLGPGLAGWLHAATGSLSAVLATSSGAVALSAIFILFSSTDREDNKY